MSETIGSLARLAGLAVVGCFVLQGMPARGQGDCRIGSVVVLSAAPPGGAEKAADPPASAAALGGLSDLFASKKCGAGLRLCSITDRGPNGTIKTSAGKRRTLLSPDFQPAIIGFDLDAARLGSSARAAPTSVLPLAGRSGRPLSGRPNGIGNDEPILDASGDNVIPDDPNGVDTEGLVQLTNGTFWLAEEYRPSLLEVAADGRAVARYVPRGHALPDADMDIHEVLPAEYGSRRDNRGFEALAVSPDESRLWALVQSPLDHPVPKAGRKTGNVRLLGFDLRSKRPVSEHVYRLGDPTADGFLTRGAPPADGKLCAMAAVDAQTLLVLEQSEEGIARLYRCPLGQATNTLGRSADAVAVEQIGDLAAAGIMPLGKELVADLAPLRPMMLGDVYGEAVNVDAEAELKLEGLAILDPRHVAIVNDNDFGVHVAKKSGAAPPRTCLWVLELAAPVSVTGP